MLLRAELQAMATEELSGMVNSNVMAGILARDAHPRINAYVIGHEGVSDVLVNGSRTPVTWIRKAIEWINEKVQLFIPAYMGHGAPGDNSDQNRQTVGEVVGKKLTQIGDRVATVLAVYINPAYRDTVLDVASIEADVTFERNGDEVRPIAVDRVTGIALGNSQFNRPGFPGATLIGALQAFADGSREMQTVAEVKAAVAALGVKPSDLFKVDELVADRKVTVVWDEEKADRLNQITRLKTKVGELQSEVGELTKTTEKYEAEVKVLKSATTQSKAPDVAKTIMQERKLSDKAQVYINKQLKRFKSEATDENVLKVDLNKFIDEAQGEYKEFLKDMGLPEDKAGEGEKQEQNQNPNQQQSQQQNQQDKGGGNPPDTSDDSVEQPFVQYTSAKTNPLLAE